MKVAPRLDNSFLSLGMAKFLICLCFIMSGASIQAASSSECNGIAYKIQKDPQDVFMYLFWYNLDKVKQIDYTKSYISSHDYQVLQHTRMQIDYLLNNLTETEKTLLYKFNLTNK